MELVDTELIAVCDREADIHDLFARQQEVGRVALLVRTRHDRSLGKDTPKLFDTAMPACGHLKVAVPRPSARRAVRGQKASAKRGARVAKTEARWRTVDLPTPGKVTTTPPFRLTLIHVLETDSPTEVHPLAWFLLTTLPVTGQAEAELVIEWYRLRWRIESEPGLTPQAAIVCRAPGDRNPYRCGGKRSHTIAESKSSMRAVNLHGGFMTPRTGESFSVCLGITGRYQPSPSQGAARLVAASPRVRGGPGSRARAVPPRLHSGTEYE